MRAALVFMVLVTTNALLEADSLRKDIVGTWKIGDRRRYGGFYTLRADSTYYGEAADMIFGGRWSLKGKKLVLWSYIDHEKKIMTDPPYLTVFMIHSVQGDIMRVTEPATPRYPVAIHELWKKTP